MQYSDTTNKNGIIQREEMLCGLGDGGISNDSTLLKQFTALNNSSYFEIWMEEMAADFSQLADDYNYTDIPDAPITTVTGQADYTLPVATVGANVATFLRVNGLYYTQGGERIYIRRMNPDETLSSTNGVPTSYIINGKSITFNCPLTADFVSLHSTFHVEFQRIPDAFTSADTTQQPGFMESYHELIPLRSSAKYLLPLNPNLSQLYTNEYEKLLMKFKRDISNVDDQQDQNITSEYISHR